MANDGSTGKFECKRCGRCCHCGSMWTGSEHPVIKTLFRAWPDERFPDDGQCAMLAIDKDGQVACLIELHLGKEYKPDVCNDFPEDPAECHRIKLESGG